MMVHEEKASIAAIVIFAVGIVTIICAVAYMLAFVITGFYLL